MTFDQYAALDKKIDAVLSKVRDMELKLAEPVRVSQLVFGWREMIVLVCCFVIPSYGSYWAMKASLESHIKQPVGIHAVVKVNK